MSENSSHGAKKYKTWHHLVQRGLFMAQGFSETAYEKPWVAIANTWSELNPGHYHLRNLAEAVKRGVWQNGGTPVEFNTGSICDGMALDKRYHLPTRDLIAFMTTHLLKAHNFAGCIFLSSCDKNVPGQLMAAASVDIPSIFVTGGSMLPGRFKEEEIVCCTDGRRLFGDFEKGNLTQTEFEELLDCTHYCVGACGTMGTANTMQALTEALGMCLPGSASIPAVAARKAWLAEQSGKQIMQLIGKGISARKIMTKENFTNTIRVLMAMGGSTNAILHLTAIARQAGVALDLARFDAISAETPFLCDVKPSGSRNVKDFADGGGVPSLQRELISLLDLSTLTVTGNSLGDNLATIPANRNDVVKSMETPISTEGGIVVLSGNLCPAGAIIKKSGVAPHYYRHRGPAKIFESYKDFEKLMHGKDINLQSDQVIVIRNEGPRGGPGMQEILIPPALYRQGLEDIVIITDGRTSGTTRGRLVVHTSPEAAMGGAIGIINDGDMVNLDIEGKTLTVELSDNEINVRQSEKRSPLPRKTHDWMRIYQTLAGAAEEGAGVSL